MTKLSTISITNFPESFSSYKTVEERLRHQSQLVLESLKSLYPNTAFYLTADTSFSDCCFDFITAAHVNAHAIVKVGSTCLYPGTESVPVFNVHLDCVDQKTVQSMLPYHLKNCIAVADSLVLEQEMEGMSCQSWREIDRARPESDVSILTVNQKPWVCDLLSLLLPCNKLFKLEDNAVCELNSSRIRSLRWAILSGIPSTATFGIIVHSSSKCFADLAIAIGDLMLDLGIPHYTINVGVLTPTKLGNYPDIDAFVILGCPRLCFSAKEFFKPLITCFELFCYLQIADYWNDLYTFDPVALFTSLRMPKATSPLPENSQALALSARTNHSISLLQQREYQGVPTSIDTLLTMEPLILKGVTGTPRAYSSL